MGARELPKKPVTAVIIGAGHRSMIYASYANKAPNELKIVGLAEPDNVRAKRAAEIFDIPSERCFHTAADLAAVPAFADAAINGTMDQDHVSTTLPLLDAGYHVLLEKPISPLKDEFFMLLSAIRKTDRIVMICHELRYAPFYSEIYKLVSTGEIGRIISMHTYESINYNHMAESFVRGKFNRYDISSSTLLQKCCHDLDLIAWMKSGVAPKYVSSFGGLSHFRLENAPEGSGHRCLVDCQIEDKCPYSAKKNYIEQDLWGVYVWGEPGIEKINNPSIEQKLEHLRTKSPHGRCVWRCDNDIVDHQSVIVEFEDGSTATHDMFGVTSKPTRTIHICGTLGEIEGALEEERFFVRKPDARKAHEFSERTVNISTQKDEAGDEVSHGGGDLLLVQDFVRVVRGEEPSLSTTDIEDSVYGHLIAYAADKAMQERIVVEIRD